MDQQLIDALAQFKQQGKITVMTGAGISAESGIPTFRGPEGYWTFGSKEYHPQEMATFHMLSQYPEEVWRWYLYRMGVCRSAEPNPGHFALVDMEAEFGDRFTLITQNIDGLHLRAGNSLEKTMQIHGNVSYMRCLEECTPEVYPIPEEVPGKAKEDPFTEYDRHYLRCPRCGSMSRPHILLFDESYNEHHYHFHSALEAAQKTDLLIIVGTAGATNLPNQVAMAVYQQGGTIIDINIEENTFSDMALRSRRGFFVQKPSGQALPEIFEILAGD
ncbi:SIR2 family NAD-dependent protein deacylase [Desulfogranum marinum]|uniref:SIR2 family NAD-dependent protein deacylase n=1 Tax=Desulfogranum marinum TaxID=453220 RepID=UPI0019652253|nr:Sir2 family NAD-dependent protein deacetylase [Desulfogranum marinum]MBM9512718.1 RNA polymerase subunit sigma [Desulfogranum marinum]